EVCSHSLINIREKISDDLDISIDSNGVVNLKKVNAVIDCCFYVYTQPMLSRPGSGIGSPMML
ncbi:MAG: hypothetical protein MUO59_05500, partial [Actinobacteria bacterium]|nr:hypothetical protein [Actinomycetota bacterium]